MGGGDVRQYCFIGGGYAITGDTASHRRPLIACLLMRCPSPENQTTARALGEARASWALHHEGDTRALHVLVAALLSVRGEKGPHLRVPVGVFCFDPTGKHNNSSWRQDIYALGALAQLTKAHACCSDRPWSTQGREHGEALAARPRKARTSAKGASASPQAPHPVRLPGSTTSNNNMLLRQHALPSPPPTTAPPPRPSRRRPRQQQHLHSRP